MADAKMNALMRKGMSEAQAAMVSLKKTKAEKKADSPSVMSGPYEGEDYPYGTRLELNEDQLDKLDLELKSGAKVHIMAEGKVISVSESSSSTDGKKSKDRCNATIQITKLAIK